MKFQPERPIITYILPPLLSIFKTLIILHILFRFIKGFNIYHLLLSLSGSTKISINNRYYLDE